MFLVLLAGIEPSISTLKGLCPRPLDDRSFYKFYLSNIVMMSDTMTVNTVKTEKVKPNKSSVIIFKYFVLFIFGGRYRIRTYGTFHRSML